MDDQYKTRQTLIQRVKKGQDEQSWDEFLRIYRPFIYSIIHNMNISESDADDIVQQVLMRLLKYLPRLKDSPDKRFRSWLSTVTANCVKDFARERLKEAECLQEVVKDESLSYLKDIQLPEVERIAEREWGIFLTNLAMERIADVFTGAAIQVFFMSLDGVSVAEIARKMELKENSVYRLKNRVKERLALEVEQLRMELE